MKIWPYLLVAPLLLATTALQARSTISAEIGTRKVDFEDYQDDENAHFFGGTWLYKIPKNKLRLGVGGSMTQNYMDADELDYDYLDLALNGTVEYRLFPKVTPYGKLRYILMSWGEADDFDAENSGYDLGVGAAIAIDRGTAVNLEYTMISEQEFDLSRSSYNRDVEYDYTAIQAGVSFLL